MELRLLLDAPLFSVCVCQWEDESHNNKKKKKKKKKKLSKIVAEYFIYSSFFFTFTVTTSNCILIFRVSTMPSIPLFDSS